MTLKVVDNPVRAERVTTKEGLEAVRVEGGEFREITIGEGEMFLLPGALAFSLVRSVAQVTDTDTASCREHAAQPVPLCRHGGHRRRAGTTRLCRRCASLFALPSLSRPPTDGEHVRRPPAVVLPEPGAQDADHRPRGVVPLLGPRDAAQAAYQGTSPCPSYSLSLSIRADPSCALQEWMSTPELRVCPECGQQAEGK